MNGSPPFITSHKVRPFGRGTHNRVDKLFCFHFLGGWFGESSQDIPGLDRKVVTLPETNNSPPLKIGRAPKGKDRLPIIHFQVLLLLVSGRVNFEGVFVSIMRHLNGLQPQHKGDHAWLGGGFKRLLFSPYLRWLPFPIPEVTPLSIHGRPTLWLKYMGGDPIISYVTSPGDPILQVINCWLLQLHLTSKIQWLDWCWLHKHPGCQFFFVGFQDCEDVKNVPFFLWTIKFTGEYVKCASLFLALRFAEIANLILSDWLAWLVNCRHFCWDT